MKKVLVVDDEADIVELVSMILDEAEVDLLAAYDGQEAPKIVAEQHPDLVLTDVMMPRLNGSELCDRIKADPATSDTVVIFMTAHRRSGPCAADGCIYKPFDNSQMLSLVQQHLTPPPPNISLESLAR
jgi:CheY-like chemotaxis protein